MAPFAVPYHRSKPRDANSVNASSVAVGSVDAGSLQAGRNLQRGQRDNHYANHANGSFFVTAFGINDSGRIVGQGIDPRMPPGTSGSSMISVRTRPFEVGALPGLNGAPAFGGVTPVTWSARAR